MSSLRPSSLLSAHVLFAGSLLFLAGCTTPPDKPPAAPAASPAVGAYNDDARALTPVEKTVAAAGLDPAKLAAAQHDFVTILQQPGVNPATAQEAAQQLGLVLLTGAPADHTAILNSLSPLLVDPAKSDHARLALDRVPGTAVDALYLQALPSSTGRTRLGLIDSIGTRAIAGATPALAGLLNDADPATAAAAARALGRIGGQPALDALAQARDPLAPAVLTARLTAAAKTGAATAAKVAGEIYRNNAAPLAQRSAALRLLIAANPTGALDEIHAALSGAETAFHAVAIESVSILPGPDAGAKLAARLGSYAPTVQIALITALGHRSDPSSIPALLATLDGADAGVRLAALEALGRLPGNPEVAQRLATLAAGKGETAKAAFASLARLDGPGLDDLIRTEAATDGDSARRAVFVRQIAARNLTEAIPFLLGLRQSPVDSLRLEALDALRAIAGPAEVPPVIAWSLGAGNQPEQVRAVRALISILLRDGAVDTRAAPVIIALNAGDAAARTILLPVLSRVGGAPALAAAGSLARDADAGVATAATAELARWPDSSALPVLVDLAATTRQENVRTEAVQGAARFLAQNSPENKDRRSAQTRALLALPVSVPACQSLLNVLSLCADQAALDTARSFVADPAVAAEAQDAVDAITSNLAGRPVVTASVTTADPARMADGDNTTVWQVAANEAGTWIRMDLHNSRPVRKVTLDHRGRTWGFPESFDVQVSNNPEEPGTAVAQGEGDSGSTVVSLPAGTRGRYVWIRLTGKRDAPLAIAELLVE